MVRMVDARTSSSSSPAAAAAAAAALVLLLVASSAAPCSANLRLTGNGDYSLFAPATTESPVTVPVVANGADNRAQCAAVWHSRANLVNPEAIEFTFDDTKQYTTMAAFGAAIDIIDNQRHRAPMFTFAEPHADAAAFAAPIVFNYAGVAHAPNQPPAPFNHAAHPRVYLPAYTGRELVVVVPTSRFADFKLALAGAAHVHVVGALARRPDGDRVHPHAAELVGRGFMRFAALELMRAARAAHNGLARAWLVDDDVVALVSQDGARTAPAHFDDLEAHPNLLVNDQPHVFAASAVPDLIRARWTPAELHAGLANVVRQNARLVLPPRAQSPDQMVLFDLTLLVNGAHDRSFPSAFVTASEEYAFYTYLSTIPNVAAPNFRGFMNLKTVRLPLPPAPALGVNRGGRHQTIDAASLTPNLFHYRVPAAAHGAAEAYVAGSSAEFVRDRMRGACGENILDTGSKALEQVMVFCLTDPDLRARVAANENLDHFFRHATTVTTVRA